MKQSYVLDSMDQMMTFGPHKGMTRGDLVMKKLQDGRYNEAANAVMDALMIDDPPPGADDELAQALSHQKTLDQVALVAADWGTKHFRAHRM